MSNVCSTSNICWFSCNVERHPLPSTDFRPLTFYFYFCPTVVLRPTSCHIVPCNLAVLRLAILRHVILRTDVLCLAVLRPIELCLIVLHLVILRLVVLHPTVLQSYRFAVLSNVHLLSFIPVDAPYSSNCMLC
jgi:hypothetical protein